MYTLNEDGRIGVYNFQSTGGTYQYEIQVEQPDGNWGTAFNGRCYIPSGETKHIFCISDVLNNLRSGFDNVLSMSDMAEYSRPVRIYDRVRVVLHIGGTTKYSISSPAIFFAYHYPYYNSNLIKDFPYRTYNGTQKIYNLMQGDLLPHIPCVISDYFPFCQTLQFNTNYLSDSWCYKYSGGIQREPFDFDVPDYKYTTVYNNTTNMILEDATCNGEDGILSVWTNEVSTDVTTGCMIYTDGEFWHDVQGGYWAMLDPRNIEVYDADEENIFFGIYEPEIEQIGVQHFSGELDVDFTNNQELYIYGTDREYNSEPIIISNTSAFIGKKRIRLSIDYQYTVDISTHVERCTVGNIKVEIINSPAAKQFDAAIIDACPSRLYLIWQDRYGGYQSQRFDKTETFSEDIERETIKNYRNESSPSVVKVQPKWKINSGWIDEDKYPYYESIFCSPELLLYDSKEDKKYLVNVTDSNYTQKTFKNQGRKLFNLELNLEENKKQTMIY